MIYQLPLYFHPKVYNIEYSKDCELYKNMSAVDLFKKFDKEKTYTKLEAISFFKQCKNKNAALLAYNIPNFNYKDLQPPYSLIPTMVVVPSDFVDWANTELSELLNKKPLVFPGDMKYLEKEKMYYEYWKPILEKEISYGPVPIA